MVYIGTIGGHKNGGDKYFKGHSHTKFNQNIWAQCELIANHETGKTRVVTAPELRN